jgi:hypothetical protein
VALPLHPHPSVYCFYKCLQKVNRIFTACEQLPLPRHLEKIKGKGVKVDSPGKEAWKQPWAKSEHIPLIRCKISILYKPTRYHPGKG